MPALDFKSLDGKKAAYEYQVPGARFVQETDFRCLIADAMGLGKTIQSLIPLRGRKDKLPILVVQKSATTFNWVRESLQWLVSDPSKIYPILGGTALIFPGSEVYIVSMDMFARYLDGKKRLKPWWKKLLCAGIKTVILDECHSFKDDDAARTHGLINYIKAANIENIIGLSGTPIKSRADEYFTILNLIAPDDFPSRAKFRRDWLIANDKGIYTRVAPWRLERFQEMISHYVLRREKHEVLRNLPPIQRNYQEIYIEDPQLKESYNKNLSLFEAFMNSEIAPDSMNILGWLAKLRRITAQAKTPYALQFCKELLETKQLEKMDGSPEPVKICLGVHHNSVRDTLYEAFRSMTDFEYSYNPLKLSGENDAIQKDRIVEDFRKPEHKVLVANTLAGGVGLNIQHCNHAVIVEREWTPADEEQFESRFHRNGQEFPVTVDYLLAHGTIDQWFHELIEEKKKIVGETLNGWNLTSDSGALKDLAHRTIAGRL